MNEWSLVSEYFALILLMLIALFIHDTKAVHGFQRRRYYYLAALSLSAIAILLNISATTIIENIADHSVILAMTLNTLYFLVCWLAITVMVYYLFLRVLEFVYDTVSLTRARVLLWLVLLTFTVLLFYNLFSGILFYFDNGKIYCRGPLNFTAYALPIIDVFFLIWSFVKHRRYVGNATQKALFVAIPITLLLIAYQVQYPEHLLNGSILAIINLIIFISYRGDADDLDFLTNLDNRHSFEANLIEKTEKHESYQIILVKIRYFSRIVSIFGQSGYNAILFQLGETMRKLAGDKGTAFRYSEERFALMFNDADTVSCEKRLAETVNRMRERYNLGQYETTLEFYAIDLRYSGQEWHVEDIDSYLNQAVQQALSEDKEVLPFTEQLFFRHQLREYILRSMHTALEDGRFHIYYQPVYYHSSGKFESCEALMRMNDETGNPISPGEFIPVAEETGMLDKLLEFLLENACRLLSGGEIEDLKSVSINLPIREFLRSGLKDRFRTILDRYGVRPEQIKLEITERDVDETGSDALKVINDLHNEGFPFMLDDFGIAYSNLSRVLSIPFESIKLDRSLVLLLEEKAADFNVLKEYIIPLFFQLGQNIVAEGVETAEMADYVLSCGIDRIQGYYYARPMSKKELLEWYHSKKP